MDEEGYSYVEEASAALYCTDLSSEPKTLQIEKEDNEFLILFGESEKFLYVNWGYVDENGDGEALGYKLLSKEECY